MALTHLVVPLLSEHQEAVLLAQYLGLLQRMGKIHLFTHVPNETYTPSHKQRRKNAIEGVSAGVPDYIIVTPTEVLFLELKRRKHSATSQEQKEWLLHLSGKTTHSVLAKGFDEAKSYLDARLTNHGRVE